MALAHSLSRYSPGSQPLRRSGPDLKQTPYPDEVAQEAAQEPTKPRWQIPLYHQPERPSRAAIAAYQASIAAERRLSVPHGVNLLEQADEAEALMEANDDFRHCDCCEAPIEVSECRCPYCDWRQ
jgi:hypothetical protein